MKKEFSTHLKLIKHLKKGDELAYTYLVKTYFKVLCDYAFGLSRDHFVAEDLVQNVLIRFWEKRKKLKSDTSIKSFLYKSVYNEFINLYRKEVSTDKLRKKYFMTIKPLYEEGDIELDRLVVLVKHAIEQLPPRCKEIFLLSKKEGLTYVEIADYLNISQKTVENQMGIAFTIIRKKAREKMHTILFLLFGSNRKLKSVLN
ncbi:RNA polymerase sigma factor [Flavivirga jejuensis]|uniref:RNA polymerase sigma-70 factor n=1 Tax=Flavivirga jejuensis TaxID=870487 RepID=A0ABT8WR44_9FLAO|nr:RNA polymerase sigma-70 factor [Flavivirga jejuensis]MDO5975623.1 RNA polymerase sigma-70 factor [Flavivirga jejuensis]